MPRSADRISPKRIRELLWYSPETGHVFYKSTGERCDRRYGNGYHRVWVNADGVRGYFLAHRIAFVLMTGQWPVALVDHINREKNDNRWINLRQATVAENGRNAGLRSNNTSGYRGVSWDPSGKKWRARIFVNYKCIFLGSFSSEAEAYEAYKSAALRMHGEFCNVT